MLAVYVYACPQFVVSSYSLFFLVQEKGFDLSLWHSLEIFSLLSRVKHSVFFKYNEMHVCQDPLVIPWLLYDCTAA